jgi:hypothetical protein
LKSNGFVTQHAAGSANDRYRPRNLGPIDERLHPTTDRVHRWFTAERHARQNHKGRQ